MIQIVFDASEKIKDNRTQHSVLGFLMEEVGELALEVNIANGASYKEEGEDGIIGEAIDVIAVALDMIYITNPNITKKEINKKLAIKTDKWLIKQAKYVQ